MKNTVILTILDGFGLTPNGKGNAVKLAKKPNLQSIWDEYTHTKLEASGLHVGLPDGQMGNSEVGHLNIGAGRKVYQSLVLINKMIDDGEFFKNEKYLKAIEHAKSNNSALHIMGLLSDGGVHSHIKHINAMVEMAAKEGLEKVYVHAFLDGRDVAPSSAKEYVNQIEDTIKKNGGTLATVSGRYYSMDRDKRWDRVQLAYDTIILGETDYEVDNFIDYIDESYAKDELDEFVKPAKISGYDGAKDGDSFIFMNFRPDRALQLSGVITNENYNPQPEENPVYKPSFRPSNICFIQTMHYSDEVLGDIAFEMPEVDNPLGEVIANAGLHQLRIAETEKYPHVTYFFDGGLDKDLPGAKRVLIQSPKVATYDLKPEMSAKEVTDSLLAELEKDYLDLVILNFANPDMVGHSGKLNPTIEAIEAVDECIGRMLTKIHEIGGQMLVTADHGNSEVEINDDGTANTAHTTNKVPFALVSKENKLKNEEGVLADIAPTILDLLNVEKPKEMTGMSLIDGK